MISSNISKILYWEFHILQSFPRRGNFPLRLWFIGLASKIGGGTTFLDSVILLTESNHQRVKSKKLGTQKMRNLFRKERRTVAGVVVFAKILQIIKLFRWRGSRGRLGRTCATPHFSMSLCIFQIHVVCINALIICAMEETRYVKCPDPLHVFVASLAAFRSLLLDLINLVRRLSDMLLRSSGLLYTVASKESSWHWL
jgi:hypothetical protein